MVNAGESECFFKRNFVINYLINRYIHIYTYILRYESECFVKNLVIIKLKIVVMCADAILHILLIFK